MSPVGQYRGFSIPRERDSTPLLRQEPPKLDHPCTEEHFYQTPQDIEVGTASRIGGNRVRAPLGRVSIQDLGYELPRMDAPRRSVNRLDLGLPIPALRRAPLWLQARNFGDGRFSEVGVPGRLLIFDSRSRRTSLSRASWVDVTRHPPLCRCRTCHANRFT